MVDGGFAAGNRYEASPQLVHFVCFVGGEGDWCLLGAGNIQVSFYNKASVFMSVNVYAGVDGEGCGGSYFCQMAYNDRVLGGNEGGVFLDDGW